MATRIDSIENGLPPAMSPPRNCVVHAWISAEVYEYLAELAAHYSTTIDGYLATRCYQQYEAGMKVRARMATREAAAGPSPTQ